jgi:hypothetical protein
MKLGEPTRQLARVVIRRTGQKYLEQTRVETRPTLITANNRLRASFSRNNYYCPLFVSA